MFFTPTRLPTQDAGKLANTDMVNEIVEALNGQGIPYRTGERLATTGTAFSCIAIIWDTGPNAEADRTDETYWIRFQAITGGTATNVATLGDNGAITDKMIALATYLAGRGQSGAPGSGNHSLPKGMPVRVVVEVDDSGNTRYLIVDHPLPLYAKLTASWSSNTANLALANPCADDGTSVGTNALRLSIVMPTGVQLARSPLVAGNVVAYLPFAPKIGSGTNALDGILMPTIQPDLLYYVTLNDDGLGADGTATSSPTYTYNMVNDQGVTVGTVSPTQNRPFGSTIPATQGIARYNPNNGAILLLWCDEEPNTDACPASEAPSSSYATYADGTVPGGDTIANTTTETAFNSVRTFAANSLVAGQTIRVSARGTYSTAIVAPTLAIKVKLGSTTLLSTGTLTATISLTNAGWSLDALLIVTATGGAGTVEAQGEARLATAATTAMDVDLVNTAPITIDTTSDETVKIFVTWGTASASNTITLRTILVELIG